MAENRFFIPQPLILDEKIDIPKEELKHLFVMRKKMGDSIEIVNGEGELGLGKISSLTRNKGKIHIENVKRFEKKQKKIILAQAIARFSRLEIIVEKAVELGVSEIWMFPSVRTEKKLLSQEQKKRLYLISIAALKQCGRLDLPPIYEKLPLEKWKKDLGLHLFGDLRQNTPFLLNFLQSIAYDHHPLFFFVGPESGFTEQEELFLEEHLGAKGVKLHENILRVDTAAIVALSLIDLFRNRSND